MVKMKIDAYSLTYRDNGIENDYKNENSSIMHDSFFYHILSSIIFCIVDLIIEINQNTIDTDKISKIIKFFILFFSVVFFLNRIKINFSKYFIYYFYLNIIIDIVLLYVERGNNQFKLCFLFFVSFSYPTLLPGSNFSAITYGIILYILGSIPAIFIYDNPYIPSKFDNNSLYLEERISKLPLLFHKTLLIVGILVLIVFYGFCEEFSTRLNYLKYNKKSQDMKKNNEIYSNLVPGFVRDQMKNGIRGAAIDFEEVTILFCDISDFDGFVASMSPKELIQLLDRIYNIFDQLCSLHGLQKIETVGKTYMAAAGLKECEKDINSILLKRNAAVRTFELSLDMIDAIDKIILENGERVKIKVGVHTGKIIAAVVGNHKPQFSLIGDAVNTTARMCAYSSDMCVLCSESAYENINSEYNDFQMNKKEVKGKGFMNIYLHNPHRPKNDNNLRDKKRISETKFINNLNFNLNNNKKNYLKKQTINVNKSSDNNNNNNSNNQKRKKNNPINRETSPYVNPENFIYENSIENNSNPNEFNLRKRNKTIPKFLSRFVTHREYYNTSLLLNELNEKNYIWQKSFFFLIFYDSHSENLFDGYVRYRNKNDINKSYISIFIYSFVMLIAIYNLSEYNSIDPNYVNILIFSKIILIIFLIIIAHFNKMINKHHKNYNFQLFIWLICFFITIIITIQINLITADYISLNLSLEQIFTFLFVSSNGILIYKFIVYNYALYIIIFMINIFINLNKMIIIKYYIYMIIICLIMLVFLVVRYYKATGSYLKNINESQNLKKIEELLFNLMPQHVVLNLKEDIPVADVLDNVTLLFAGNYL
jgi:class 3 adenylate cyclase